MFCIQRRESVKEKNKHHIILKIPDRLWEEIKNILPKEKHLRTIGRPIIPYRKVIDELSMYYKQDVSGKCYLKNTDQVLPVIVGFRIGIGLIYSKRYGQDY